MKVLVVLSHFRWHATVIAKVTARLTLDVFCNIDRQSQTPAL